MRRDETRQSGRMRSFGCADINATGQVTIIAPVVQYYAAT